MSKYIVVTGASGFIGSNLVKALNKCGYGDIPVISASFIKSEQSGGFSLPLTMLLSGGLFLISHHLFS